jgi:hypothetical protein
MGLFDWLFKRKDISMSLAAQSNAGSGLSETPCKQVAAPARQVLNLEGTLFPLFTKEAPFFAECKTSGQAALSIPFSEYYPVSRRAYEAKAIGGGTRLLCRRCVIDMSMSFQLCLPGGGMDAGHIVAIGEGLPENLFDAAESAQCPYCGSNQGILLWDHPNYGDITDGDMEAMRALWGFRCQLWWNRNDRSEGICDRCFTARIPRGEGYHRGSDVICESCAVSATDAEALSRLKENPDCCGTSELRRARNFVSGRWRFERGNIQGG